MGLGGFLGRVVSPFSAPCMGFDKGTLIPWGLKGLRKKAWNWGEIPENRPSAAKAVLILLDLCTG